MGKQEHTLTEVHGYSGNAAASTFAPARFVRELMPTKNSLPVKEKNKMYLFTNLTLSRLLPVNTTSPPSMVAVTSLISTIGMPSSF